MVLNSFGIKDILDIVLVAFLIFYIYRLMKKSSAANIFSGIIVFLIVWLIFSQIFNLRLMGTMLNYIVNIGALALVVLFQEEIRSFFYHVGSRFSAFKLRNKIVREEEREQEIQQIVYPLSLEEEKKAWEKSKLEAVKEFMLKQL